MRNYLKTIARFPFAVKWFLITEIFFGLGIGIWNVSLNFHLKFLGFSNSNIGITLALGSVFTAVFSLIAGEFGDRLGFHLAMIIGCLLKGTGIIIIAISPTFSSVLLGQLIISIGDSLVLTSEFPFLLGLVDEKFRNTVYNLLIAIFLFAMFVGNIVGGFMSSWVRIASRPYLFPIVLCGCFFIFMGIGRLFLPKKRIESIPRKHFIHLLSEFKILMFLIYGMLSGLVFNLVASMINIILREQFKLSDSNVGIAFSINTIVACAAAFFVPLILGKLKVINLAVSVQIIIIIVLVLMAFSPFKIFIVLWISWAFFRTMLPGTVDSAMLQSISQEKQGTYSGLRIFSGNVGISVGAYSAGSILMFANYRVIMEITAVVALMQLIVFYFGCRRYIE